MTNDECHHGAGVYYRQIPPIELTQLDDIFLGKELSKELEKRDEALKKEQ